jgi:hypothetical protein
MLWFNACWGIRAELLSVNCVKDNHPTSRLTQAAHADKEAEYT